MRRGALLLTILCAVVMAAPAAHAADFAITADENAAKPGVAVATNGTAHIAWNVGVPGVEQDGLPREEVVVAKYAAPGPVVPTRVRNLRIRRRGSGALATWGVSSGAREYYVRATLTDGRKQLFVTRKRSLRLPAIDRDMRATVTVQGHSAKGRRGPVATTKLARAKARRR